MVLIYVHETRFMCDHVIERESISKTNEGERIFCEKILGDMFFRLFPNARPPRFKISTLENLLNPRLGVNVTPLEYDCTRDVEKTNRLTRFRECNAQRCHLSPAKCTSILSSVSFL